MTDSTTEAPYVLSDKGLEEIRRRVTATCSCCGENVHDFDTADVLELLDDVDRLRKLVGHVREIEWGSGRDESYVKVCGTPNDAYDYARAYGEHVFVRKLYAGPWEEDSDDDA